MRIFHKSLAVFLCWTIVGLADGNVFNKIRYNGGSVKSSVNPKDWGNSLTISPDVVAIDLRGNPKTHFEIPSKSITSLSYGQEAHRRVGTMLALAILISPVALFGLFHKTRLHFIGIQYQLPDGTAGGVLLQGDKNNYRAVLFALQGVSGAPVSVSEKEREYLPVGITSQTTMSEDKSR